MPSNFYKPNAPLAPACAVSESGVASHIPNCLTPAQARTLATLNTSLLILKEIAALPEVGEMALQRALVAAKTANESCDQLQASMEADALFARLGVSA